MILAPKLFILILVLERVMSFEASKNCVIPDLRCPNRNITFWLYTRHTKHHPYELKMSNKSTIRRAPFVFQVQTIVLIHGYTGWKDFSPNSEIRPAYLRRGQYNVISVDFNSLAKEGCYEEAAENVPLVAKCLAQLIDFLVFKGLIHSQKFHIIGFSLGAHIAGQLSNWLTVGKLPRITGLDPASPGFYTSDFRKILDKNDAKFVDVFHTNALVRGYLKSLGHADFYFNGGSKQPGCEFNNQSLTELSCDHLRAPAYYAESVTSKVGFYGRSCKGISSFHLGLCKFDKYSRNAIVGYHTPSSTRGNFFVDTNDSPPYARGRQ